MKLLLLDGYVLCCPAGDADLVTLEEYVLGLSDWWTYRQNGYFDFLIGAETAELLAVTNSYPSWESVTQILDRLELSNVEPRDIFTIIEGFLTRCKVVEELLALSCFVVDSFHCEPCVGAREPVFAAHFAYASSALALCHRDSLISEENSALVTRELESDIANIKIDAKLICEFINERQDLPSSTMLRSAVRLIQRPSEALNLVKPSSLWTATDQAEVRRSALLLNVRQMISSMGIDADETRIQSWKFGPAFFEHCAKHGFLNDETKAGRLLEALSKTILDTQLRSVHALRTGLGGNNPQCMRGLDKAWRRDIDYEYHLHYWQTASGPEFASVGPHNFFSIPL